VPAKIIAVAGKADLRGQCAICRGGQPGEPSSLLGGVTPCLCGDNAYNVLFRGAKLEVDFGWFIHDSGPGPIMILVQDPEHAMAVGTPQEWAHPVAGKIFEGSVRIVRHGSSARKLCVVKS